MLFPFSFFFLRLLSLQKRSRNDRGWRAEQSRVLWVTRQNNVLAGSSFRRNILKYRRSCAARCARSSRLVEIPPRESHKLAWILNAYLLCIFSTHQRGTCILGSNGFCKYLKIFRGWICLDESTDAAVECQSSNNEARTYQTLLSIMIHVLHFISPSKLGQDWILPEEISERSILASNLIKNFQKHHEEILNTLNSNLP